MSRDTGNWDKHISIFSNTGRLYQVEYTFRAARTSAHTSIAIRGEDTVVVVTQKKVEDSLIDPSSVTHMFTITPTIGCVMTGRMPDCRALVMKAREIAHKHAYDFGYDIPVDYLAQRVAEKNQVWTQQAGTRPLGAVMILCGIDDEHGPMLYKVDPSGVFASYRAAAAGEKEVEATSMLEKLYKREDDDDDEIKWHQTNVIRKAIATLQDVLSLDFKASDIEVAVVSALEDGPGSLGKFEVMADAEVDAHLVAIAEED